MKALFIPVYSNIDGIKNLYNCIDYEVDLVHIISKPEINLEHNPNVKQLKITNYSYKFKSFSHGEYNTEDIYNFSYNQKMSMNNNNIIDLPDIIKNNLDSKFILKL